MTCEDFLIATTKIAEQLTRAERAVVYRHAFNCKKCFAFLRDTETPELSPKRLAELDAMLVEDYLDPEFLEVVEG